MLQFCGECMHNSWIKVELGEEVEENSNVPSGQGENMASRSSKRWFVKKTILWLGNLEIITSLWLA